MNLYLRLLWTLFRTSRLPRIDIRHELERTFRVLPNDLDINRHMNNGRYLTMIDLLVIEYFARTGFLRVLMKNRWHPIVGGSVITYRRELRLGQKYKLRFRWDGSDEFWNYLHFDFVSMDGRICASGYTKGAAAAKVQFPPISENNALQLKKNRSACRQKPPHADASSNFVVLRRFCAVAANVNSHFAPFGPLRRNLSSPMICFIWAKSISTLLRARREAT